MAKHKKTPTIAETSQNNNNQHVVETNNGGEEHTYDPTNTWVKEVHYQDGSQGFYEPMEIDEDEMHDAKFSLPNGVEPSIAALMDLYFNDNLL